MNRDKSVQIFSSSFLTVSESTDLGRYIHKVAFTAHRIKHINDKSIRFQYKDYADKNLVKEMTLSHEEFLRRFEQHILLKRFVKIRHVGYLAHRGRTKRLQLIYQDLKLPPPMSKVQLPIVLRLSLKTGMSISICSVCKTSIMILGNTKIF